MSLLRAAGCNLLSSSLCGRMLLLYSASFLTMFPKLQKSPNSQILLDFSPFLLPHWSHVVLFAEMRKCLFPTSALDIANLAPISWNFLANSHRRLALQAFSLILQTESLGQAVKWTRNCPLHLFLSGPWIHIQNYFFLSSFSIWLLQMGTEAGWCRDGVLPTKHTNLSCVTFILVI